MTNQTKVFLINSFLLLSLILSEAWALRDYFGNRLDFEPVLAFVAALIAMLSNSKMMNFFGLSNKEISHDQSLFQELQKLLPYDPTIRLLKEHDFGNAFRRDSITPLNDFIVVFDSVEKEFLDSKLEEKRKKFLSEATSLASEIAQRTVPLRDNTFASVYSDSQRDLRTGPRPAFVIEDAKALNAKATSFTRNYERFIRYCKKRLNK